MNLSSKPSSENEPKTDRQPTIIDGIVEGDNTGESYILSLPPPGSLPCTSINDGISQVICSTAPDMHSGIFNADIQAALKSPAVPKLTVPPSDSPKPINIAEGEFDNSEPTMECAMDMEEIASTRPLPDDRVTVHDLGITQEIKMLEACDSNSEQINPAIDDLSKCTPTSENNCPEFIILGMRKCTNREIESDTEGFLSAFLGDDSSLPSECNESQ